jgi:hypothetical protein
VREREGEGDYPDQERDPDDGQLPPQRRNDRFER